ncbi:MAG: HAD family hydrolase [Candidatus Hadarchaeota archaeon]
MIAAKAVIFDLDCTLVDTLNRFFEVFNELLEKHEKNPVNWAKFFKNYIDDSLDDVVAPRGTRHREAVLHDFWLEFLWKYREGEIKCDLISGVKKTLEKLHRQKVPIAVITSCIVPSVKLSKELEGHGIGKFVKTVVTAHDVLKHLEEGHHFSKAEIFRQVMKNLKTEPQDCVVVGDYWNDIRDGKKAGAKTVGVLTGLMRRELLEKYKPDAVIASVRDLPKVVKFSS